MAVNTTKKKRASASVGAPANGFAAMRDLVTQMESFIKEAEALAAMEIRRLEEIKESLKASVTRLTALFREKEAALSAKERASTEMEESLASRARELEGQLKQKESALLAHRETLRAMEVRAARPPIAKAIGSAIEVPVSTREIEEESSPRLPQAAAGGTTPGDDDAAHDAEPGGGGIPVREADTGSTRTDRREAESTGSRLVSLLGPIKRRG